MFSIQKKLKNDSANAAAAAAAASGASSGSTGNANAAKKPVDLRQRLLQKEFESLKQLPIGCSIKFDNPDVLHKFKLYVKPDNDSIWKDGKFEFLINVPEGYRFSLIIFFNFFSFFFQNHLMFKKFLLCSFSFLFFC